MKDLENHVTLYDDEKIIKSIEGDAYNISANPLLRLLGTIIRFLSVITGNRRKLHVLLTNRRVIFIDFRKMLWVINKGIAVSSVTPRSIHSVGYNMVRSWLFFKTNYFSLKSSAEHIFLKFKGGKEEIILAVNEANNILETIRSEA